MRTASTTGARSLQELADPTTLTVKTQERPNLAIGRDGAVLHAQRILLCHPLESERKREAQSLTTQGHHVVEVDSLADLPYDAFRRLLHGVDFVRFNVSVLNFQAWKKLVHISAFRSSNDGRIMFVCTDPDPVGDFADYVGTVIKADWIEKGEGSRRPAAPSIPWGLLITHRFWMPGTKCAEGEEVFDVAVFRAETVISQPLSTKLRLQTDFFATHRLPQNASQFAGSMNADRWVNAHGLNAPGRVRFRYDFSRTSIKRDVWKIRNLLAHGFRAIDIMLDPPEIIEGIPNGREVRYRLNPAIKAVWRHVEL